MIVAVTMMIIVAMMTLWVIVMVTAMVTVVMTEKGEGETIISSCFITQLSL